MESRNCSIPAPELFTNLMHYSHVISFPVYIATFIILFRESSKLFRTYKYFIIVHVFINVATESYVSFFMLPVTYLPLPLLRTTGWLSQLGFSGLVQFYGLAQMTAFTIGSILEMFYYRLKVTIVLQTSHFFPKFAKYQLNVYRFLIIIHPIITTASFEYAVEAQINTARKTWNERPTFPPEITCYSVVAPVLDNEVFWTVITVYLTQVTISVTGSVGPLIYIVRFIKRGSTLSKETMKLQKILIISLFIQGGIHSIFIIIPSFFMMYAIFFELHEDKLAQLLFLSTAYHGFLSTCGMIMFTKPLRDKFFFCSRWKNRTGHQVLQQSSNRFSSTVPA